MTREQLARVLRTVARIAGERDTLWRAGPLRYPPTRW
jgi:hypothetical protein